MNEADSHFDPNRDLLPLVYSSGFLESFSLGLLLRDGNGVVVDSNRAVQDLLNVSAANLIGQRPFDTRWNPVRPDGSPFPLEEQPGLVTLHSGNPSTDVVMGVDISSRTRRWLSINTFPILLDGVIKGELCSITDVTSRRQEQHVMRLITEMNKLVMQAVDEDQFLAAVSNLLVNVGGYALVAFVLGADDDAPEMIAVHMAGVTDYVHEGTFAHMGPHAVGQGPVATAFRTRVTQVANELATHAHFETAWRQRAAQFGIASLAAIPIVLGRRNAVLTIYGKRPFIFDELTVSGLENLAKETEFGAAHVRSVKHLGEALDGTLAAISRVSETHDPFTSGHQVHVGALGAAIATDLGLDARTIKLIRQGGEVCDIGKVVVSSEILAHPGGLTPVQFAVVQGHAASGADILSQASLPWPIAEIALQHHERMDGSGYPAGLRGDQIIMPARIIAVADVVEAMTQPRPYRGAHSIDDAMAEIADGSGTRYDERVATSCLAVMRAGFTFDWGPSHAAPTGPQSLP